MWLQLLSLAALAAMALRGGGAGSDEDAGSDEGSAPPPGVTPGGGLTQLPAAFLYNGQPLRFGPDRGYEERLKARISDSAAVLARSSDGLWVYVLCQSGDGWAPRTSMQIEGDWQTLPIWTQPIHGYATNMRGSIERQTDLKNGFDKGYETLASLPPAMGVGLLAHSPDTFWLFVWADSGKNGWVPRAAVQTSADWKSLPTWHNVFQGANHTPRA